VALGAKAFECQLPEVPVIPGHTERVRNKWWKLGVVHTLAIPAFQRLRQEEHEFQASLGYVVKLCLKKTKKKNQKSLLNS
jgi:hypothetical protein